MDTICLVIDRVREDWNLAEARDTTIEQWPREGHRVFD